MTVPTRREVIDFLIYLAVRAILCVVQCLSLETASRLAKGLAWIAYRVDRRHRDLVMENLRIAFGDRYDEPTRRRMALRVFEHFCLVLVETALIPRKLHVYNWHRYAQLEAAPEAIDLMVRHRGKIVVTGHFGNWEMGGQLLAATALKPTTIARDLDNRHLHAFVKRLRSRLGQRMVSKKGDYDKIVETLEQGQTLVSVGDQSAGPRGCFVDFFGRPSSTHKAIALLSVGYDAPVIVGYAYRDQPGFHYRVVCLRPLDPAEYVKRVDGVRELTQDFTKLLETGVRKAPEQYFWLHNRWKHSPPRTSSPRAA